MTKAERNRMVAWRLKVLRRSWGVTLGVTHLSGQKKILRNNLLQEVLESLSRKTPHDRGASAIPRSTIGSW